MDEEQKEEVTKNQRKKELKDMIDNIENVDLLIYFQSLLPRLAKEWG